MRSVPVTRTALVAIAIACGVAWRPAASQPGAPPDTSRAARALVAVADSLCAAAARAAARGELARADFGSLLRPALTAQATARCPARTVPLILEPGRETSIYRLTDFQVDGDSVQVRFEWEGGVPNAPGMSWFTNGFSGTVTREPSGAWVFHRHPGLLFASDGALTIRPPPAPWWRRWWCHLAGRCTRRARRAGDAPSR